MAKLWNGLNSAAAIIAGLLLGLTMLVIGIDVVARYIFNSPIVGVTDLVTLLIPAFVFLPLADTEIHNKHIRVEFITQRWRPSWQRAADMLAFLCGFFFLGFMAWVLWGFAIDAFNAGEFFPGLRRLRTWPSKFAMAIGATLFLIQCLSALCKSGGRLKAHLLKANKQTRLL